MNPVSEEELHAYVDDQLDASRRGAVEAYLAAQPEEAERVAAYRRQNDMLHALFDPVLAEPLPRPMKPKLFWFMPRLRLAAAIGWLTLGGLIGWFMHGNEAPTAIAAMPRQAAIAHVVYTPEVRHPVEVGADQEAHLVAWLSKRLGMPVRAPQLNALGFQLVGGRLLPGETGPAAQFMYQNSQGQRLTLYVRSANGNNRETAFRFAQEGRVGVFYWVDGALGYALSGEAERAQLLEAATLVYRGLNS